MWETQRIERLAIQKAPSGSKQPTKSSKSYQNHSLHFQNQFLKPFSWSFWFGSTEVKKLNSVCSVVKKKCMVIVKLCQQWEEEM
ncbi:hypothetical protein P8452_42004 [Trifolium repens]|nr:hypothetical protein P8452_42004 [Trifolium repens]